MWCSVNLVVFGCGAARGQGLQTQRSMRMHFLLSALSLCAPQKVEQHWSMMKETFEKIVVLPENKQCLEIFFHE